MSSETFLIFLLCSPLVLCCHPDLANICEEVVVWDSENERLYTEKVAAHYDAYLENYVKGTKETSEEAGEKKAEYGNYAAQVRERADCYLEHRDLIEKCNNNTIFMVLDFFKTDTTKQLPQEESSELKGLMARVSGFFKENVTIDGVPYSRDPGLFNYMKQRKYDDLWKGWKQYHDYSSAELKEDFVRIVSLTKKSARNNGFADMAEKWLKEEFNDTSMEKYMDQLLKDMFPLFTKVHAYVRSKLFDFYKDKVPEDHKHVFGSARNPIPVHILGDMLGEQWSSIGDLVVPYPDENPINFTKILFDKNYDAMKLFKLSESFFTSLGLDEMTDTFWEKSYLEKTGNMVCTAFAYDMKAEDDYRILMCTRMDDLSFYTVHHEMGHIVNYMLYKDQPYIWRKVATNAFSEAIGDTIVLSARSRKHLEAIGFVEKSVGEDSEDEHKQRINDLMQKSLHQISFLPFLYSVEKWRFGVFRGEITPDEYNKKWWEFRKKYHGLSPPVKRPDDRFDLGSKFHIPNQFSFIRYFYSFIGQFQFHEALCKAAGQTEDLDNCDIYHSKEAGQKLKDFLSPGKSRPWKELLQEFTGSDNFQSTAIVNYFKPLDDWLTEHLQQNNIPVGWDGMWDMKP